jgi:hypothetical protein
MVVEKEPIAVRVLGRMSRNHIKGADQGTRASGLKSHAPKVTDGRSKVQRRSHSLAVCCYGGTTGMGNARGCWEMLGDVEKDECWAALYDRKAVYRDQRCVK